MKRTMAAVLTLLAASVVEAGPVRRHPRPVPGSYIVVLKQDVARGAMDTMSRLPNVAEAAAEIVDLPGLGRRTRHFEHALRGFVVQATPEQAAFLADDFRVAYVEEDGLMQALATQTGATWGLDRIDQRSRPLSGTYVYEQTGGGVHAYVIDTGLLASHNEFAGRVGNGFSAINDGRGTTDCNGHGTHVAGTVGGTVYGVAKAVTIHPVRVLGCTGSGSTSGVIAGVDWVAANRIRPAVANMSLGGGASSALDQAVNNAINAGVTFAVAAGNSNTNACNSSPARVPAALTVGASTSTDARASYSNYGTCLDLFAPGSSITSAWYTSNTATNTISGTSMASPHVAAAAALFLQLHPAASPAEVSQAILNLATQGVVSNPGTGSPNRLLYTLSEGGGTPGDVVPPTVSITFPSAGTTVSGTITVSANTSDDSGSVSRVELYVDGSLAATDSTAPFSFSWNTATVANGAHTLSARAYDPSSNAATSAGVGVTVQNETGGAERLANGGFEGSASPWVLAGDAYWSSGGNAHSGTGYTVLGFYDNASGSEYQTVTIPASASGALTFWLNVTSSETTTSTVYDRLFVEVRNTGGTLLATLGTFSNLDKVSSTSSYSQRSFSLASFRGQTVRLQFRATTDVTLATAFRVDDVSLR